MNNIQYIDEYHKADERAEQWNEFMVRFSLFRHINIKWLINNTLIYIN